MVRALSGWFLFPVIRKECSVTSWKPPTLSSFCCSRLAQRQIVSPPLLAVPLFWNVLYSHCPFWTFVKIQLKCHLLREDYSFPLPQKQQAFFLSFPSFFSPKLTTLLRYNLHTSKVRHVIQVSSSHTIKHQIHPFWTYNSLIFGMSVELCNYDPHLI